MPEQIQDRLHQIEGRINQPEFMKSGGAANEINYYIFDYDPQDELAVRDYVDELAGRYQAGSGPFSVTVFDLFEVLLRFLKENDYLEMTYDFENRRGLGYATDAIVKALGLSQNNQLVKHIVQNTPPNAVVFLTGVGKCYPVLRSHNIINNLQQAMDTVPVVLFYPGTYENFSLKLFGTLSDGNHYRALPLVK